VSAPEDSPQGEPGSAFFPYRFDRRFRAMWGVSGARPDRDGVTLTADGRFRATYGRFVLDTPIDNVTGAHVTGPYRWWTAVGVRLSFADDGLTFGTNRDAGVCVHFAQRVRAVIGPRNHSALTVTVEDLDGLVAALPHVSGS
jgi:hypothetical protein